MTTCVHTNQHIRPEGRVQNATLDLQVHFQVRAMCVAMSAHTHTHICGSNLQRTVAKIDAPR